MPHKIDKIWCAVATEADGSEQLPALKLSGDELGRNMLMPLLAADEARLADIIAMARLVSEQTGQTIRIYEFGGERTLVETIAGKNEK